MLPSIAVFKADLLKLMEAFLAKTFFYKILTNLCGNQSSCLPLILFSQFLNSSCHFKLAFFYFCNKISCQFWQLWKKYYGTKILIKFWKKINKILKKFRTKKVSPQNGRVAGFFFLQILNKKLSSFWNKFNKTFFFVM